MPKFFVDRVKTPWVDWLSRPSRLMSQSRGRTSRPASPRWLPGTDPATIRTAFYREEFLKHRQCLELQREYFSERAIRAVDAALGRIMQQLEELCSRENADEVVSRLLKKLDLVTNLSAWTDPRHVH